MYTVSEMSPGKIWGRIHFLLALFTQREVYMVLYSQVNYFCVILRPRRGCRQKKNEIIREYMESALYGIYARVVDVSEIERVSAANE